jgi:toxin ParE1/3/4
MRALRVTRAAEADLLEIWLYLFEKSEQAADRVTDEIAAKYDLLCKFPHMGRRRGELGVHYRSLPVGNYVIFYRVSETQLEISRVLHGARDLTGIFTPESEEE